MTPFWIAIRPKTLIASISPVAVGTALAFSTKALTPWVLLFTLLCGIGIQISCNVANDLFDYLKGADTQDRKGPLRVTASGLLTVTQVKLLTFSLMGITAIFGTFLVCRGGLLIALALALALLLALGYTAGPFPLAYLGLAEFFILIFFGPVATGLTYYLQTLSLSASAFLAGLPSGMLSCGILIINNLRDIHADRAVKKRTLVARFGVTFGKWEYTCTVLLAPLFALFTARSHPLTLLSSLALFPAFLLCRAVFLATTSQDYIPLLARTGTVLVLWTATFCLGIIV